MKIGRGEGGCFCRHFGCKFPKRKTGEGTPPVPTSMTYIIRTCMRCLLCESGQLHLHTGRTTQDSIYGCWLGAKCARLYCSKVFTKAVSYMCDQMPAGIFHSTRFSWLDFHEKCFTRFSHNSIGPSYHN